MRAVLAARVEKIRARVRMLGYAIRCRVKGPGSVGFGASPGGLVVGVDFECSAAQCTVGEALRDARGQRQEAA